VVTIVAPAARARGRRASTADYFPTSLSITTQAARLNKSRCAAAGARLAGERA
jgi:hypothetical protein